MRNRLLLTLAAMVALLALPFQLNAQSYTTQAGVSLFVGQAATATATSAAVRLPTFSGTGTLTVTESGITGSPSGCTIKLYYQSNAQGAAPAANTTVQSTISITPSTGVQTFTVSPAAASGDNYVAVYACSSTYPTAGLLSVSFSPITTVATDPCFTSPKSTASISITTATTTALVAVSAGKSVYLCGLTASVGASSTLELEYGTGTACATTQTVLSGTITPATGGVVSFSGDGTRATAPASNGLCIVSTGTGGIYGIASYVQQ